MMYEIYIFIKYKDKKINIYKIYIHIPNNIKN